MAAAYYVMPRYEAPLDTVLANMNCQISPVAVADIAVNLIESLKTVHATGRTYNDLKPENIMISGSDIKLIDFGLCDHYIDL